MNCLGGWGPTAFHSGENVLLANEFPMGRDFKLGNLIALSSLDQLLFWSFLQTSSLKTRIRHLHHLATVAKRHFSTVTFERDSVRF